MQDAREQDLAPDDAFRVAKSIQSAAELARSAWPRLAMSLFVFHRGRGWRALGFDTFNEWIAQPEISLSRSSVYAYIDTYKTFCADRALPLEALGEVDPSKLRLTLRAVKAGEVEPDRALADALSLSKSDLRVKYACPLPVRERPEIKVCPTCGQEVKG